MLAPRPPERGHPACEFVGMVQQLLRRVQAPEHQKHGETRQNTMGKQHDGAKSGSPDSEQGLGDVKHLQGIYFVTGVSRGFQTFSVFCFEARGSPMFMIMFT